MEISIGILAGGKSSRMGKNKALMKLNGKSFLEILLNEFKNYSDIMVSQAYDDEYKLTGCRFVSDTETEKGPLEGICRILEAAKNEYVFICAADMPFLKKELANFLTQFISTDIDCCCIDDGEHLHPLCAVYSKTAARTAQKLISENKLRLTEFLQSVRTKRVSLEYTRFDKKLLYNINTYEEYLKALRPMLFCVSGIKNSGKTALIEKLTAVFSAEGKKAAVIKHDGHNYISDHAGTDTDRFTKSGAVYSCIFSDDKFSVHAVGKYDENKLIEIVKNDVDIIILEGFKYSEYPKIEIVRKGVSNKSVCTKNVMFTATDIDELLVNDNYIDLNDTERIIERLKRYFEENG
ncbi:MAG: molybdopterin-guanine dinucleotide biosynthesis protein B [Firmicutes bacterium]|nr:molybdopterin-guanine dinucleotide biosynthesis protein B [Bacillota bacterium]